MTAVTMILFVCGIYLMVMTVKMKKTGVIPSGLVSKKINMERAKDIPGYINFMYVRGLIFGLVLSICSAILVYADFNEVSPFIELGVQIIYLGAIVFYAISSSKAQNKYLL